MIVLVLVFMRMRMSMIVGMRVHEVPMAMGVLVAVHVIVRVLVGMHVAVPGRMIVIVRHGRFPLVFSGETPVGRPRNDETMLRAGVASLRTSRRRLVRR